MDISIVAKYFYVSFSIVFMLFHRENLKSIIFSSYCLVAALYAQDLEDLSFGDGNSLDVAT